jgi:hypothetical protein
MILNLSKGKNLKGNAHSCIPLDDVFHDTLSTNQTINKHLNK